MPQMNITCVLVCISLPLLPLPTVTVKDVTDRIEKIKKPQSYVKGDKFPALRDRVASSVALAHPSMYNIMSAKGCWPNNWKTEFLTPIPKIALPKGPNDLRNILCTAMLSKVYKSFVLEWPNPQTGLRGHQFGGVKRVRYQAPSCGGLATGSHKSG